MTIILLSSATLSKFYDKERKRYKEAIAIYNKCLDLEPENSVLHFLFSEVLYLQGQYSHAIEKATKLVVI